MAQGGSWSKRPPRSLIAAARSGPNRLPRDTGRGNVVSTLPRGGWSLSNALTRDTGTGTRVRGISLCEARRLCLIPSHGEPESEKALALGIVPG
eukprot:2096293-Rhodomonas_salina.1